MLEEQCCQKENVWIEVNRLHSIRDEREMESSLRSNSLDVTPSAEKVAVSTLVEVSITSGEGEGWKLMTSSTRRKGEVKFKDRFGCSDHKVMGFGILREERRMAKSKLKTLDSRKADLISIKIWLEEPHVIKPWREEELKKAG